MEDKIRVKVINAYGGIVLEESLKRRAKGALIKKAQKSGRTKFLHGIMAAAAVVIVVFLNIMLIRFNLGHEEMPIEAVSTENKGQTIRTVEMKELDEIQTPEELKKLAESSNAYVLELENSFYVAVLCYDRNGEPCFPGNNTTATIEYVYFDFEKQNADEKGTFTVEDMSKKNVGVVFWDGDWYEVWEEGLDFYYELYNITSPHRSNYPRYPEDEETMAYIRANTVFFAGKAEEDGYLTVGRMERADDGEKLDYPDIDSRRTLENLIAQSDVYSVKFTNDTYFVVTAYRQNKRCSLNERADSILMGCYVTENDEIAAKRESLQIAETSVVDYIGASSYDGDFFLISKEKDTEKYRIETLRWDFYETMYCDEWLCPDVYANATFFARLVTEDGALYWQFGENIESGTDYSSKSFCEKYSWDEQCTKEMTLRDIYVAKNWIGGSAAKFAELEHFFKEPVQTEHVTADKSGAGSKENAYQTDYYFECAGFRVSTEPGSDEIVSAALLTDHDYVTENVWIGMNMESVRKNMGMNDKAFFEYNGNMFATVEQDGLLYEFQFQEEKVGENLPPHASYPAPDYVLTYAEVSDAAKIKTSSVKSMGEHMFGDGHSLEEGKDF